MADITIEVPLEWIPQIITAIRRRYPDLADAPNQGIVAEGMSRMVRETLRTSEGDRIEKKAQQAIQDQKQAEMTVVETVLSQIRGK